jgi:hypothetical protein
LPWACTYDLDSLKWFDIHGGVAKVLDFLKETTKDMNCVGAIRMDCIACSTRVIWQVTCLGENGSNKDVATKIPATLMDCDGINTLIDASEEYTEGEDVPQLTAVNFIWRALRNITFKINVTKDTIALFDTGIDTISRLKSVPADDAFASKTLEDVFYTLANLVDENYVIFETDAVKDTTKNDRAVALFYTGIEVTSRLKSVPADEAFASKTLKDVFYT